MSDKVDFKRNNTSRIEKFLSSWGPEALSMYLGN
jgi:hypothetical protein